MPQVRTCLMIAVIELLVVVSSKKHKMPPFRPCFVNNGGCEQICTNVLVESDKYTRNCSCRPHFILLDDGLKCNDTRPSLSSQQVPLWKRWGEWVDMAALRTFALLFGVLFVGYLCVFVLSKICGGKRRNNGAEYLPLTTKANDPS